jgi:hypothetical protein
MQRTLGIFALVLTLVAGAVAQDLRTLPVNRLIDNPTAGLLARGTFDFEMTLYAEGGVLVGFNVGLLERLNMGASFGGTNIVSDQDPDWNGRPELSLKYRVVDESIAWPAILVGYSGQGRGRWLKDVPVDRMAPSGETADRYEVKAKGFYGVAGKNFTVGDFGLLGLHAGANLNPVENEDDRGLNLWLGLDKEINRELSAVAEYDLALDDVRTGLSRDKGFLNLGLRWTFAERLSLEVDFKDVLKNRRDLAGRPVDSVNREIKITYIESF